MNKKIGDPFHCVLDKFLKIIDNDNKNAVTLPTMEPIYEVVYPRNCSQILPRN